MSSPSRSTLESKSARPRCDLPMTDMQDGGSRIEFRLRSNIAAAVISGGKLAYLMASMADAYLLEAVEDFPTLESL